MIKKGLIFSLIILVLALGTWFVIASYSLIYSPLLKTEPAQPASVKVFPKTGIHALARSLHESGYIDYPRLFIFFAEINRDASRLKIGEYSITKGMTAPELLANIVLGKVMQRKIIFIEGWTFREDRMALNNNSHLEHQTIGLTGRQIMEKLGHPNEFPEGLFFPDTYYFTWGDSDLTILKRAYDRMQKVLTQAWSTRASGLPYKNSYSALIVASMIEKETALPKERARIAGVIVRRLEKHMRLQVDPTVVYGLGRPYGSEIKRADLLSYTPYNTYREYGLPPTPIDMPSKASIIAALHPAPGEALYYVSRGDGSHQFSKTYREHLKAIKKYLHRDQENDMDALNLEGWIFNPADIQNSKGISDEK